MSRTDRDVNVVSVIMPFLNTPERYLREAISSVQDQTYPHWELILINDGSESEISAVARNIASDDPDRIIYLSHPGEGNRGTSRSRNLGIEKASGELIAFIDADDVWLPDKLEEQVEVLARFPDAEMLCGNTLYWYSWSGRDPDQTRDHMPRSRFRTTKLVQPPRML